MDIFRFMYSSYLLIVVPICFYTKVESCNEVVCASIVSKCMLTQSCKCEPKHCSCCKDCLKCLDLCPKPNDTRSAISRKSHVEDFDGVPELFNVLTSSDDDYEWEIFTFQIDFDTLLSRAKLERDVKYYLRSNEKNEGEMLKERDDIVTVNCTVIYYDQCTSWNKCKKSCQSTGASSYR
ncbi:protein twisted gastrulation isoform X2 [Teleopsis dalmanni]|uniref:protein twisted gastrulation isoform X2 n=1 Tax=Teleopsis dalmanni TaxID=139649 RepID=UPI0018CE39D6|nr:protein twisted gastrulation isoform X2 [Teleopsis dalmanni]